MSKGYSPCIQPWRLAPSISRLLFKNPNVTYVTCEKEIKLQSSLEHKINNYKGYYLNSKLQVYENCKKLLDFEFCH